MRTLPYRSSRVTSPVYWSGLPSGCPAGRCNPKAVTHLRVVDDLRPQRGHLIPVRIQKRHGQGVHRRRVFQNHGALLSGSTRTPHPAGPGLPPSSVTPVPGQGDPPASGHFQDISSDLGNRHGQRHFLAGVQMPGRAQTQTRLLGTVATRLLTTRTPYSPSQDPGDPRGRLVLLGRAGELLRSRAVAVLVESKHPHRVFGLVTQVRDGMDIST